MRQGHVSINGKEYFVDLRSYKRRDIIDFSPRASVAGGSIYGELGLYQTLQLEDWQGGFGYPWHTATKGNVYMRTTGEIDTRHAGYAMRMTQPTTDPTTFYVKDFMSFAGDVYAWSSQGAIKFTSSDGAWTTDLICTDALNDMWNNGYYIFGARTGKTPIMTTTDVAAGWSISTKHITDSDIASSDYSEAWVICGANWDGTSDDATSDQVGFTFFHNHDGYVFSGQETGTDGSSGHFISYDSSIDLSDIYTVSSDDPNMIPVGVNGMRVLGAESFRGDLLFFKWDGIYRMNADRSSATMVINYKDQASSNNFRDWSDFNGQLIFPVRDKLYSWNGVRTVPADPPTFTDHWPLGQYGNFDNFVFFDRWLFLTGRTTADANGDWEEHLLAYDGVGWHNMSNLVASTDGLQSIVSMHYDPDNDRMWYCKDVGTDSDAEIAYIPFQPRSRYPYEDFSTDGIHRLEFPRIDAGYRKIKKSTPSVLIAGQNCDSAHYLELLYRMDGSTTWLAWGADSGVSNVLTTDGVKLFDNPTGEDQSTLEYNYIEYAIDFVCETSTATPILEGFYPRLLIRPDTLYGWSMQITASKDKQYGTGKQDKSVHDILKELQVTRGSYAPVDFVDMYGDQYKVYLTSVNESAVEYHIDRPGAYPDVEQTVLINLVEVG